MRYYGFIPDVTASTQMKQLSFATVIHETKQAEQTRQVSA
jgi:hypothetical protein